MNIEKQLIENAEKIEQELLRLTEASDVDFAPVLEALRYSLIAPRAKRIRPMLTLEFCRLFGGQERAALL